MFSRPEVLGSPMPKTYSAAVHGTLFAPKIDSYHFPKNSAARVCYLPWRPLRHALRRCEQTGPPELIVGHGVLGQLLARLTRIIHGTTPTVWERDPARRPAGLDYAVYDASQDPRHNYSVVCDVSGSADALNQMIARCKPGATVVMAGFTPLPSHSTFHPHL